MVQIWLVMDGDRWMNPHDLREKWPADNRSTLVLRMSCEGPSLWATGIVQETMDLCRERGRPPGTVWVADWSNSVEEIPFARYTYHARSHFFWLSDSYRHTEVPPAVDRQWFAFFVGRATPARARMLHDLVVRWPQHVLTSVMRRSGIRRPREWQHVDPEWLTGQDPDHFYFWCSGCAIPSLDGHSVQDQYDDDKNTNRDILAHYARFSIEIVAETYTLGNCFFPTEKTIRPLSQGKGMLIHAPKNFLRRLRELGFQTWHSIWDESYDELEGFQRWERMRQQIANITEMDQSSVDQELDRIHRHNTIVLQQIIDHFKPNRVPWVE